MHSSGEAYLIWSNEHRGWWGIGENGYTRNLNEAGHYNRDRALKICRRAILTAAHIWQIAEFPVRLADVREFLDGQDVPEAIAQGDDPYAELELVRTENAELRAELEKVRAHFRASLQQIADQIFKIEEMVNRHDDTAPANLSAHPDNSGN